jgi:hypothetical protein
VPNPDADLYLFRAPNTDNSTPSRVILPNLKRLVSQFSDGPATSEAARTAYGEAGYVLKTKPLVCQVDVPRVVLYLIQNDPRGRRNSLA